MGAPSGGGGTTGATCPRGTSPLGVALKRGRRPYRPTASAKQNKVTLVSCKHILLPQRLAFTKVSSFYKSLLVNFFVVLKSACMEMKYLERL